MKGLDSRCDVGTGVRINCISPGQIDVGVDLKGVRDVAESSSQILVIAKEGLDKSQGPSTAAC